MKPKAKSKPKANPMKPASKVKAYKVAGHKTLRGVRK